MTANRWNNALRVAALVFGPAFLLFPSAAAIKNMAVIASAASKLSDVPLAELAKLCKGSQKTWSDGRSFTLIMKDPESPDMHVVLQKLFGMAPADLKANLVKLNESRELVKIVASDDDLLRAVAATPGAVGVVDVYTINSSVKVLRIDGKLPFDVGYALKSN
jgi:ABC-type phosphate transport system substrate-binding protein